MKCAMKQSKFVERIRDLLNQGIPPAQIIERVGCDSSYGYRVIKMEQLKTGVRPVQADKLARLEERVRQLEKTVAALASMRRFGGLPPAVSS